MGSGHAKNRILKSLSDVSSVIEMLELMNLLLLVLFEGVIILPVDCVYYILEDG
jgi:hypothetical protein